jgi:uncharacterized membrane protein SpoIIM required for sporulation
MSQSIEEFIESRRPRWKRLESLILALEKGKARQLNDSDLSDIGRLYREATADLARLQAFEKEGSHPEELAVYLNHLVARAHGQIYRTPTPGWAVLWNFLKSTFPKTFRQTAFWTIFALVIFLLASIYGFWAALSDDSFIPLIVSPHIIKQVEQGEVWFDSILAVRPLASSKIMTNNISVTFLAFALGMTFGFGTFFIMVLNGLMLGTVAGLCHLHGLDVPFWSFVLPHGVIELSAIFIAGGAGFLLGTALLVPGDLPRKEALVQKGRQAVRLVLGCVPLLIVAGIVEGFFSPAHISPWIKFLMAGLLLALFLSYLLLPTAHKSPLRLTSK